MHHFVKELISLQVLSLLFLIGPAAGWDAKCRFFSAVVAGTVPQETSLGLISLISKYLFVSERNHAEFGSTLSASRRLGLGSSNLFGTPKQSTYS